MSNELEKLIQESLKEYIELNVTEVENLILNYLEENPELQPDDIELVCQDVISSTPFQHDKLYFVRRKNGEEN